jgi:hypothetical protein
LIFSSFPLFPHLLHKESEKEHFLDFRTRSCRSILKINGFFPTLVMAGKQSQLEEKYGRNCSATKMTRRGTRRQRTLDLYIICEREA